MKPAIVMISAALVVACSVTEPVPGPGTFTIDGLVVPPPAALPGTAYEPVFRVTGQAGAAVIEGSFWGSACGDRVDPEFLVAAGTALLRLSFVVLVESPQCLQQIVITEYTAVFTDLEPGSYRVAVEYDLQRAGTVRRFSAGNVELR